MAKNATKINASTIHSNRASAPPPVANADVVALAYELWLGRGCPIGSPEADWFRAEELLRSRTEPPLKAEVALAVSGD